MEEIVTFLREEYSENVLNLQEAWEHHRIIPSSWFASASYDSKSLQKSDPTHWTTCSSGLEQSLSCLRDVSIPSQFVVLIDWRFHVSIATSRQGWKYYASFQDDNSQSSHWIGATVRKRLWQRLVVHHSVVVGVRLRLSALRSVRTEYRTLGPSIIQSALKGTEFRVQMVVESERYEDYYHSRNLQASDPPHWSCGADGYLLTDPRKYRVKDLQEVALSSFDRSDGWEVLHEFIYTLYPNKDPMGWEYNRDFHRFDGWTDHPTADTVVRRRLWVRTCVRNHELYHARMRLQAYIRSHPRGISKSGKVFRQSWIRKQWKNGIAVLNDKSLDLFLENNYRSSYSYSLQGCEVSLLYDEIENSYRGEQWKKSSSSGAQLNFQSHINSDFQYQFGLRKLTASGGDLGLVCVLSVSSQEEKDSWIAALAHQCALVNLIYWPFSFGPPIVDHVLAKGELWKKGHLVPTWKYRTFELRQNGTLAYFKGSELKGKIRLRGCSLQDENTANEEFTFSIRKNSGYMLYLRATDKQTMKHWKEAITSYIIGSANRLKDDSPLKGKLPEYSQSFVQSPSELYSSIYRESQGSFHVVPEPDQAEIEPNYESLSELRLSEMATESSISVPSSEDIPQVDNEKETPSLPTLETPPRGMTRRATVGPGVFVSDVSVSPSMRSPPLEERQQFTHQIEINKTTGRRVSLLNDALRSHVEESGLWEASDDENEEEEGDRDSKIITHQIQVDTHTGRKKSILHEKLKDRIDESGGVWEADEDEDSDSESDGLRASSRLSSFNLSLQYDPVITSHARFFPSVEEEEEEEPHEEEKNEKNSSRVLSFFGFLKTSS